MNIQSILVADILDSIPSSSNGAVSIRDLCIAAGIEETLCNGYSEVLLTVLRTFDAITIIIDDTGEAKIKAKSITTTYFIKSLAAYIREDKSILSNWERLGISKGSLRSDQVLSGPQFLYLIEQGRTANNENALALRKTTVVKAIIKARIRGSRESVYLVQYDSNARQYQLLGGHIRNSDIEASIAMKREIEEELGHNFRDSPADYDLLPLANVSKKELSSTYGVYTEYDLQYYQPIFNRSQLVMVPGDQWITKKELLSGKSKDGVNINESAIPLLDKALPGGLDGLRLSLRDIQHRSVIQVMKDHPWETAGIILGIIGIVLSILFFFLSL